MEPKIKESEFFKAKISNRSSLEAVEDIKNKLSEEQKNIFKRSCFGHFLDVKELKFSAQLLHSILLREVKSDEKMMWFRIERKDIRFSLEEFALVTGLDCSPLYEPNTENNDDDYRIVDEFLNGNCAITTKELRSVFLQAESDDDMKMVKLAMLYFVESVLLGKENRNHINETNVLLVDNFTEFNEFPWGRTSFQMTIHSLRKGVVERAVKPKKKSTADSKYKGATYSVHGFPHAFLVWAYEAVSVIGDKCAKHYGDFFPRILRWKSTKPKDFEEIQTNILNKKASRMVFIEKLHAIGDVEANKHYMRYFSEEEWLKEIGEENDNGVESDSHPEANPSHDNHESHDSELNSFDGPPDDSDSDGAPTSSAPRTLPPEHLNGSASIPAEVKKKRGDPSRHASRAFRGSILEDKVNHLGCRIQNIEENIARMENTMKNMDAKIDNIEGKIGHIIQLLQQSSSSSSSESEGVDLKPMNDPMDVASGQSPMQQPLDTLVNLCSTERPTDMMTPADCHGTEEDPIIVSTQEKDCRLVYNLRKRKDMKTSTYLRTPYTNPLKKPREMTNVEVHPQEELLELQRWMDIKNDKKEPKFIDLNLTEVNREFFRKLYTPDMWLSNLHIDIGCYYLRKEMSEALTRNEQAIAIMDSNFLNNLKDRHKIYLGDPDRVWEKDCYCIDYANGAKLNCATPWKNVSTVYLPIFMNEHWVLGVVDIPGGKICIYDSMIDLTKDSVLVRQLLPVADMIPLILQKIAYYKTHPDCAEVISKIPWPIVRVSNIPQQKSGGDCGAFLLLYLEVLAHGLDVNSYCQQDHVTQFRKALAVKLWRQRSWKKTS